MRAECLCVCICAHSSSASLCNRGRKSQDDGDFKTGLQLLRKPVHCMFFSSGLSDSSLQRLAGLNRSKFGIQVIEGGVGRGLKIYGTNVPV